MSARLALIIANTEYSDPNLAQLHAPGKDAEIFAHILGEKDICAFDDVKVLVNEPEYVVSEAIEEFFANKKPEDLRDGRKRESGCDHTCVAKSQPFLNFSSLNFRCLH